MKTFTFHYSDTRESKTERPDEDSWFVTDNEFGVADGVTIQHVEPYPTTSMDASKVALEKIKELLSSANTVQNLAEIFKAANHEVAKVENIKEHQGGLTTAFGFVRGDVLYFGQLNDCGVMVFDQKGNMEIDFVANQTDFINHIKELEENGVYEAGSEQEHKYIREELVNKKFNFGVMNGDPAAVGYFHVGATDLKPGQTALLYTDGFIPYVYDKEFTNAVISVTEQQQIESFISEFAQKGQKYQKERTLIVIKPN